MPDEIRIDRDGGLAVLALTATDRRNALTVEMAAAMSAACDELDADASVGAVVVHGEGGYFCAGGDRATLSDAGNDPADPERFDSLTTIYQAFTRVGALKAPTVAAVEGGAVGAGLNLAMATDVRVVARDIRIASGFLPIGLHPGGGHTGLLGRLAGREATAALALFGQSIDGARAVEIGLAWAAVDAGTTLEHATALTSAAAADPQLARRTKASVAATNGPPAIPWAAALDVERAAQMWSMRRAALKRAT